MSFRVTHDPIDVAGMKDHLSNAACGACVVFEGWIRNHNEGRAVQRLEYEVYRPIAVKVGTRILAEAVEQFDIADAACTHREGMLELADTAVVAIAVAAHREEAFQACQYIIDQVKLRLPIWKKEHYANGDVQWVNCQRCAGHTAASTDPWGHSGRD